MNKKYHLYPAFENSLIDFNTRIKQQGRSKIAINGMTNHISEFLNYIQNNGCELPKAINQDHVDDFWNYLHFSRSNMKSNNPLSASYINKFREAILRYLEYLSDAHIGKSNFKIPYNKKELSLKNILTRAEIQLLFNACDNSLDGMTDKCILALLYGCGLRRKELMTLETNELNLTKGMIRLNQTKTKQERDVIMSPAVKTIVEQYLYSARNIMIGNLNEHHFIVTQKGTRMSNGTLPFRLNKISQRAGLNKKISPHQLRHSIATHLLDDLTLEEVAQFLGHKCLDATQIYTHIQNETL